MFKNNHLFSWAPLFSLYVLYYKDIPRVTVTQFWGIPVTGKSVSYLIGFQVPFFKFKFVKFVDLLISWFVISLISFFIEIIFSFNLTNQFQFIFLKAWSRINLFNCSIRILNYNIEAKIIIFQMVITSVGAFILSIIGVVIN